MEIVPFSEWKRLRHGDAPGRSYTDTPGGLRQMPDENLYHPRWDGGAFEGRPITGVEAEEVRQDQLRKIAVGRLQEAYQDGINPRAELDRRAQMFRGMAGVATQPRTLEELIQYLKFMRGI